MTLGVRRIPPGGPHIREDPPGRVPGCAFLGSCLRPNGVVPAREPYALVTSSELHDGQRGLFAMERNLLPQDSHRYFSQVTSSRSRFMGPPPPHTAITMQWYPGAKGRALCLSDGPGMQFGGGGGFIPGSHTQP